MLLTHIFLHSTVYFARGWGGPMTSPFLTQKWTLTHITQGGRLYDPCPITPIKQCALPALPQKYWDRYDPQLNCPKNHFRWNVYIYAQTKSLGQYVQFDFTT